MPKQEKEEHEEWAISTNKSGKGTKNQKHNQPERGPKNLTIKAKQKTNNQQAQGQQQERVGELVFQEQVASCRSRKT